MEVSMLRKGELSNNVPLVIDLPRCSTQTFLFYTFMAGLSSLRLINLRFLGKIAALGNLQSK
jgi:hypothetical protein